MQKVIDYKFGKISYAIYGQGKAIILLHGFGEDSTIWRKQVEFLQYDYQVITIDIAGTGASSYIKKENVTIEDYALAINEIMIVEKLENICLFGHSMGGYIALAFAEENPEKLWGFGLIHSSPFPDTTEKIEARKKSISFIDENGSHAFLKITTPNLFYNQTLHAKEILALIAQMKGIDQKVLVQYYRAMIARKDRTEILKALPIPALFVAGEHDKAILFESSLKQTFLADISFIQLLRCSAHMGILEETQVLNNFMGEYLQLAVYY
jgi:pimeloyl-ACP methyl ester carboxylesterase